MNLKFDRATLIKGGYIYAEMILLNADGIDFVEAFGDNEGEIITSYTKEEWIKNGYELKTCRKFWRLDENGTKVYINDSPELLEVVENDE